MVNLIPVGTSISGALATIRSAEECPVWLGKGKRTHHSFPDPALTVNMDDFRTVRDDIEREITQLLKQDG